MEIKSSQVEPKVKSEYGKLQNKLKLWKLHQNNTEAEFGLFKSVRTTVKQFLQVVMVHALFGILNLILDFYAYSNLQRLSKRYSTHNNIKY